MAIKLNHCLEMTQSEFMNNVIQNNQALRDAHMDPNFIYNPILPKPDKFYEREFYFMDMTLQQREQKLERKQLRRLAKEKQTEAGDQTHKAETDLKTEE